MYHAVWADSACCVCGEDQGYSRYTRSQKLDLAYLAANPSWRAIVIYSITGGMHMIYYIHIYKSFVWSQ